MSEVMRQAGLKQDVKADRTVPVVAVCDSDLSYAGRLVEYLRGEAAFPCEIRQYTSAQKLMEDPGSSLFRLIVIAQSQYDEAVKNAAKEISRKEGYYPELADNEAEFGEMKFVEGETSRFVRKINKKDMERVEKAIYEAQLQADYQQISVDQQYCRLYPDAECGGRDSGRVLAPAWRPYDPDRGLFPGEPVPADDLHADARTDPRCQPPGPVYEF